MKEPGLRSSLNKLSKKELIDIIIRQMVMLGQLQEKNAELVKRIKELERKMHRQAAPFRIAESKRVFNPREAWLEGRA